MYDLYISYSVFTFLGALWFLIEAPLNSFAIDKFIALKYQGAVHPSFYLMWRALVGLCSTNWAFIPFGLIICDHMCLQTFVPNFEPLARLDVCQEPPPHHQ